MLLKGARKNITKGVRDDRGHEHLRREKGLGLTPFLDSAFTEHHFYYSLYGQSA